MRIPGAIRVSLFILAVTLSVHCLAGNGAAQAQSGLHHGLVYYAYGEGQSDSMSELIAARYEVGITGVEFGHSTQYIKELNPAFDWYVYNSVTDNYVNEGREQELIEAFAARHGWDPDIAYLHYYDDTRILCETDTLFIPGWIGGSAASIEDARLPVYLSYYLTNPRIATHFATPEARQLQKEVILALSVDSTFAGTDLHPDGIFFDNAGYNRLASDPIVISGGHVLETPGSALQVGTIDFNVWAWENNLGPFLTAIKDTLETSPAWAEDGKRKRSMVNTACYWSDIYVSHDVADVIFLEFEYNPIRVCGEDAVRDAWQRDSLAAAAGITSFYSPVIKTAPEGDEGDISYGESILGDLAWYLTTRTARSLFFVQATTNPGVPGWDTLTWRGCIDVVNTHLGQPTSVPYSYVEGTDPTGKPYRVWARDYESGLVLVRNRGRWDEDIAPETAVPVSLPAMLSRLSPEGEIEEATTSVTLRNGTAAILLGGTCHVPTEPPVARFAAGPMSGAAPLTVCFTDQSTNAPASWSWDFGDGSGSTEQDPCHTYAAAGTYTVVLTVTAACSSETDRREDVVRVIAPEDLRCVLGRDQSNPTRMTNGLAYSIPVAGNVRLELFGIDGRRIALLDEGYRGAGEHVASLLTPGCAAGPHFARLRWENQVLTRRIVLVK